jgi:HEPN domain
MRLAIEPQGVSAARGPQRSLRVNCRFRWDHPVPSILVGLDGRVLFGNHTLCETLYLDEWQWAQESPALMYFENRPLGGLIVAPVSREAIAFVEERRHSQYHGDVPLTLQIRFRCQEALTHLPPSPRDGAAGRRETYVGGAVVWDRCEFSVTVPQSEWLKRLAEMEWGQTELFEVAATPLKTSEELKRALQLLHEAQQAMSQGHYNTVLAHCYSACESAANRTAGGDDKKAGWRLLLEDAMPESEEKREAMDDLIFKLTKYTQVGRHEGLATVPVSREEAEFTLVTTLGLFSMLSRRLANSGAL